MDNNPATPHFALHEFTRSQKASRFGIDNTPTPAAMANLQRLMNTLEEVRMLLGNHPIDISSGYRSPLLNRVAGGSRKSQHIQGLAADFYCDAFGSPRDICAAIAVSGIVFDQLIFEGTWVHFSIAATHQTPRREVLTAVFAQGKKTEYLKGIV